MSLQKIETLKIGHGNLTDDTQTATVWASNYLPLRTDLTGTISSGSKSITAISTTGLVVGMILTSPYFPGGTTIKDIIDANSLTVSANATGSAVFSPLNFIAGKDGDIWFYISGSSSDQFIRNNGVWRSVLGVPSVLALNPAVNGTVMSFDASIYKFFEVKYSITRSALLRSGILRIVGDGVNASLSDVNVVDIGSGIGVDFDVQVSGGGTQLLYTSANAITLKLSIKGWS